MNDQVHSKGNGVKHGLVDTEVSSAERSMHKHNVTTALNEKDGEFEQLPFALRDIDLNIARGSYRVRSELD